MDLGCSNLVELRLLVVGVYLGVCMSTRQHPDTTAPVMWKRTVWSTGFALNRLQDRGRFFVDPTEVIYKGQVVGEHSRDNDLEVNLVKGKQLTNMRKSGSDDAMKIAPKVVFSLEESMEYISEDEYLEITPVSLRMRKIKS